MLLLIIAFLGIISMALLAGLQEEGEKKIPQKLKLALISRTVFLNPQIKK